MLKDVQHELIKTIKKKRKLSFLKETYMSGFKKSLTLLMSWLVSSSHCLELLSKLACSCCSSSLKHPSVALLCLSGLEELNVESIMENQ